MAKQKEMKKQPEFRQLTVMFLITAFQLVTSACVIFRSEEINMNLVYIFAGYICVEWIYMMFNVIITGKDYFELEAIAFFLSGIGLTICATFSENYAIKQAIAIGLGMATYLIILLLIKDVRVPIFCATLLRQALLYCWLQTLPLQR